MTNYSQNQNQSLEQNDLLDFKRLICSCKIWSITSFKSVIDWIENNFSNVWINIYLTRYTCRVINFGSVILLDWINY